MATDVSKHWVVLNTQGFIVLNDKGTQSGQTLITPGKPLDGDAINWYNEAIENGEPKSGVPKGKSKAKPEEEPDGDSDDADDAAEDDGSEEPDDGSGEEEAAEKKPRKRGTKK